MDRISLKEELLRVLRGNRLSSVDWVRALNQVRDNYEREDMICRFLESVFRDTNHFAVHSLDVVKDSGIYFFTGKIFEYVDKSVLWSVLSEFLFGLDLRASDRTTKKLWNYVFRIMNQVKDRELKPRLSLMAFRNCVVDFDTMRRMEHSCSLDCVKSYDFDYNESATCPLWDCFLGNATYEGAEIEGILPEAEKRRVLQSFLGASLLDRKSISFEHFLILQGTGANGKSVIFRVLKDIFGDEELLNIRLSQFSRNGDEQLRAAYSMDGKRMMYASESSRGDFKDLSLLKAISSGEPIASRKIGGNIEMMQRPPILLCNSNYRWKVSDFMNRNDPEDESMSRRALIINFDKTISAENRDTMLAQRLAKEKAGIFQWLVRGLKRLRNSNFKIKGCLGNKFETAMLRLSATSANSAGKMMNGTVTEYVKYKNMRSYGGDSFEMVSLAVSRLYDNYVTFCQMHNVSAVSIKKFSMDMGYMGFEKFKDHRRGYTMSILVYVPIGRGDTILDSVPDIMREVAGVAYEDDEYDD